MWDVIELIVETRGGFHVLIRAKGVGKVYPKVMEFCKNTKDPKDGEQWCSISATDNIVPLPGTVQGGFKVRMLSREAFEAFASGSDPNSVVCL